ncbi:hypothetical protein [Paenibacillus sp. GCM10027626]|uniref:hypothetical protein n=1 Tax=Paenibacillus sp. GCM10027626 TaxID=3273411 RepID=UPI003644E762
MAVGIGVRPQVQIGKELELVRRYVLLGIALQILTHDIRIVGEAQVKIPRLYESMLRGLQDRVLLEMAGFRKRFRDSGIRIDEELRGPERMTVGYNCLGYTHSFSMPWSLVRAEAERILKGYLSQ